MIKHVNLWKYKETLTEEEKAQVRQSMKEAFEGLVGVIPGLTACVVRTELKKESNADCMMECTFENQASLDAYRKNELHHEIAVTKVRPFTELRLGVDYEI